MKINKYKQLKEAIEVNTFEKSYTYIDKVFFGFTILAHLASIVFGYIFLFTLLNTSTDPFFGKVIIIPLITVISLVSFELLKRFLFRQTTLNYFIKQHVSKEVIGTSVLSLLLITLTFYLSLNGAQNVGDRSKVIDKATETNITVQTDSIAKIYDNKIINLEKEKQTYIELTTTGTRRVELRTQYNNLINQTNKDIKALAAEKDLKIKEYEATANAKADKNKVEVKKNILSFIIICSFIEIIILIGVWFNTYYDYRTFNEFSDRVQNQTNYKRYLIFETLLDIIFKKGKVAIGDTLNSSKYIKSLSSIKGINVTEKQIKDFFILTKHLNITVTESNRRVVEKGYDEAKRIILDYYNVD